MAFKFLKKFLLLCFLNLLFLNFIWAKATLVRLGYSTCVACHVSAGGGSQLTQYGKGVSNSESFFAVDSSKASSEASSEASSDEEKLNQFAMNHGFQARAIDLVTSKKSELFLMQFDYLNSTTLSSGKSNSKQRIDTAIGLTPPRVTARTNSGSGVFGKHLILRKLTYNYYTEKNEISIGRDLPISGLVIEDHTSYLRSASRNGVTDYVTRLRLDDWNEQRQISYSVDGPSFEEFNQNREWAVHFRYEKFIYSNWTLGFSPAVGQTKIVRRAATSLFSRFAFNEEVGFLSEIQWIRRVSKLGAFKSFSQTAYVLRPFYVVLSWLEFQGVVEVLTREEPFMNKSLQYGAGAFARVWRGIGMQFEFRQSRKFSETVPKSLWIFQGTFFI